MKTLKPLESTRACAHRDLARGLTGSFRGQGVSGSSWLPAVSLAAGLTFGTGMQAAARPEAAPQPFKLTNIHFETNGSACDMGIQMLFDTEGVTSGAVRSPSGRKIYRFGSKGGMRTDRRLPGRGRAADHGVA
jgi:hypothetical protein